VALGCSGYPCLGSQVDCYKIKGPKTHNASSGYMFSSNVFAL